MPPKKSKLRNKNARTNALKQKAVIKHAGKIICLWYVYWYMYILLS